MSIQVTQLKEAAKTDPMAYDQFKRLLWEYLAAVEKYTLAAKLLDALGPLIMAAGPELIADVALATYEINRPRPYVDPDSEEQPE